MSAVINAMFAWAGEDGDDVGAMFVHDVDCPALKKKCTCNPLVLSVPSEIPRAL